MNGELRVWLDDERPIPFMPIGLRYNVRVTNIEAAKIILLTGMVTFMSFDHDLGPDSDGKTNGYALTKWIKEMVHDGKIPPFKWNVHSQNPVGAANIRTALATTDKLWNLGRV